VQKVGEMQEIIRDLTDRTERLQAEKDKLVSQVSTVERRAFDAERKRQQLEEDKDAIEKKFLKVNFNLNCRSL